MSILILLLTFLFAAPPAFCESARSPAPKTANDVSVITLGPKTAEGFNGPEHVHFFRYQAYLLRNALDGLDGKAWKKLSLDERAAKIKAGEDWLNVKFSSLMGKLNLSTGDADLLDAVWGRDVALAAAAVHRALSLGDAQQIRAAQEKVQTLVKNIGAAQVDWAAIFDGAAPGAVVAPELPNPLAVKKETGFLDSLNSKETRAPLASKETFLSFLKKKEVPADALPPLAALYDVLSQAKGADKTETDHLLPTVVRFLNDGKKIVNEEMAGALAFAVPGDYDRPQKVGITALARTTDPILVGHLLAHEFQHIHDMYAGRYYTIDSEMRGFKTSVLYFKILRQGAPAKYQQLLNSDEDETRQEMRGIELYSKTFEAGPQSFFETVAFGWRYNQWYEGTFIGRFPLREAVDPVFGAARELGGLRLMRGQGKTRLPELEKQQEDIRKKREIAPSRDLDKALEKTTKDLAQARILDNSYDAQITLKEIRLRRMQSEVDWMNKKARDKGLPPEPFDLSLPVDKDYVIP